MRNRFQHTSIAPKPSESESLLSLVLGNTGLAILLVSVFILNADVNLASPHLSVLALDFSLTPSEADARLGGLTQLCFHLIGGSCALVLGPFASLLDRRKFLVFLTCLSSLASFGGCIIPNGKPGFFWFLLSRSLAGVAVGGSLPLAFALLADSVPDNSRNVASGLLGSSVAAGSAVGQLLSGIIGGWGGWRLVFFVHGIFGVSSALLVLAKDWFSQKSEIKFQPPLPDPASLAWSGGLYIPKKKFRPEELQFSKFRVILRVPSNQLILAQSVPGCLGWSAVATFLADYLQKDCQLSIGLATGVLGVFGLSCLILGLLGSKFGQNLFNSEKESLPIFITLTGALGALPLLALINWRGGSFWYFVFAFLGGIQAIPGPNIKGLTMSVNSATDRAVVFSFMQLVDSLGRGLGPICFVIIAWFSNRRVAFNFACFAWILSASIIYKLKNTIRYDSDKAQSINTHHLDV